MGIFCPRRPQGLSFLADKRNLFFLSLYFFFFFTLTCRRRFLSFCLLTSYLMEFLLTKVSFEIGESRFRFVFLSGFFYKLLAVNFVYLTGKKPSYLHSTVIALCSFIILRGSGGNCGQWGQLSVSVVRFDKNDWWQNMRLWVGEWWRDRTDMVWDWSIEGEKMTPRLLFSSFPMVFIYR